MISKTHHNSYLPKILIYYVMTSLVWCSCTASLFGSNFHLRISNDMGRGRVLKARCKSNNNESREQEVQPGAFMSMVLTDELFNRTVVDCDFLGSGSGKRVSGHFQVFVEGETGYACGDVCKYSAREDGLWLYDFRAAQWDFKGAWVRN